MTHRKLTQEDRDRIEALLGHGHTEADATHVLGVHPSTVSREVRRLGRTRATYRATDAERDARNKRRCSTYQGMKVENMPAVKRLIINELKHKRSPDEIAGRMALERGHTVIGTDAIYHRLYSPWGQQYCRYLCSRRYRRRTQRRKSKRELTPNRIPLNERPRAGIHGQGDLFVSPQKAHTTASVAVVCEEESQYLVGTKVPNRKPVVVARAMRRMTDKVRLDTLTLDNGIENKHHESVGVSTFFCDSHSPWQKPLVECNIGLIRRWFLSKGTDLRTVSEEELQGYLTTLNHKYRKSLGYRSAYEAARARGIIKKIPSALALTRPRGVAIGVRI
ncbi:IS30 family transposase [Candidatus Wolfebacteria bacterium]|nr:IS30 family transposase [Candidatus Wolfebacteria bacterium]